MPKYKVTLDVVVEAESSITAALSIIGASAALYLELHNTGVTGVSVGIREPPEEVVDKGN